MNRLLLAIGAFCLPLLPGAAAACDFPARREDPAGIDLYARELIRSSAAIIDAEVVVPNGPGTPARLRPLRVLKGPTLAIYLVAASTYCDIRFTRVGERVRVILSGGPDTFTAALSGNGASLPSRAGKRRFYARLDTLLGVPRPRDVNAPGAE